MTCKGYDSKAVKVSKHIKRQAAQILDDHKRGDFIRQYAEVIRVNTGQRSQRSKSSD